MAEELTQKIILRAFESDPAGGLWKPSGILVRMQEIAEDHAIALGCGRKDMVDVSGMVWMLVRLHLEMKRYPKIAQEIVVKTWHGKAEKYTFPRYFSFSYPDGEELGCATSDWVLFSIWERKLMRPSALPVSYDAGSQPAPARVPARIRLPQDMQTAEMRRVRYSDTDMNAHMNNSKYADWICDLFPANQLLSQRLSEMDITYSAEAAIDQQIELKMSETGGRFFISGETYGKAVFSATGVWA